MATRTVPPAASISAAVSMSAPGDVVEVRGVGTHSGGIVMDRPGVTVVGENPDVRVAGQLYAKPTAVDGRVTGLTLVNGGNTARVNPAIDASRFRLDHNVIDNEDSSIAIHIGYASGVADDVIVEHNVVKSVGRKPWTNYDHGVYYRNARRAVTRHNLFLDGGDYAFHFWGPAEDILIEFNLVMGGWAGAIIFGGNSGGWSKRVRLRRNILFGPPRSGRQVLYEYWEGVSTANIAAADNLADDNIVVATAAQAAVASPRGFRHTNTKVLAGSPVERTGDVVRITNPVADGYGPDFIQRDAEPPPPPPPPPPPSGDCSTYIAQRDAAIVERDAARAQVTAISAERDDARTQVGSLQDALAEMTRTAEERGRLLAAAQGERDEARQALDQATSDLEAIEDDLRKIRGSAGSSAGKAADRLRGVKGRAQIALRRLED